MHWDDEEARRHVARTEDLLEALDTLPDHAASARAREAVQALVDLYGQALARVVAHAADAPDTTRRLADDELVGQLLLAHDLHPDPVNTRLDAALDQARALLARQGGDLELLGFDGTEVRVRLTGTGGGGCGCSTTEPPEDLVRAAILARAPEVGHVAVETVPAAAPQALIPVESLFRTPAAAGRDAR